MGNNNIRKEGIFINKNFHETDKVLMPLKEVCEYLGIGESKARELVRGHNGFGLQIGNRWYANKKKLDDWINKMTI